MAWAIRHPETRTGTRYRRESTTIRWPRGLALIGLCALLLSAWGAIVPFVGPIFGYTSNGAPAWNWTFQHAMLYLVPGAVGFVVSLGILSRARGGKALARASLGLLGLILVACGAWFVIGPAAWPVLHGGRVFGAGTSASASFVNQVGYNLGVGVLLAALGGMVMKAMTGEREVVTAATTEAATEPRYAGAGPAGATGVGRGATGVGPAGTAGAEPVRTAGAEPAGTATRVTPAGDATREAPTDATREVRPVEGSAPVDGARSGSLVDAPSEDATREVPRSERTVSEQ